jgi:3-oxoacyl-[acyl-carrier protein] reductase
VLVNNAGIQAALPIDRYTDEARTRMLRVNLEAPVELIRAASKGMAERGSGRIVNVASVAAFMAHTDLWYGVTKAGVVSFTRSFASYLGPQGIQVNAVAPGSDRHTSSSRTLSPSASPSLCARCTRSGLADRKRWPRRSAG